MKIRNNCASRADDRNGKPFVIKRELDAYNLAFVVKCGVMPLEKAFEYAKEIDCVDELRHELRLRGDDHAKK